MNISKVKVVDNSKEVKEELRKKVGSWLTAVGMDASSTAKQFAPVDTGRLKNSISYVVEKSDLAVIIGTNVEYAPYQEFGTSRGVPATHFLQFGVEAHIDEYKSMLEEVLKSS